MTTPAHTCGYPTRGGVPCGNPPARGNNRCYLASHQGPMPTRGPSVGPVACPVPNFAEAAETRQQVALNDPALNAEHAAALSALAAATAEYSARVAAAGVAYRGIPRSAAYADPAWDIAGVAHEASYAAGRAKSAAQDRLDRAVRALFALDH